MAYLDGKPVFTIQCGEKGTCRFLLRAHAAPGHGASPDYDDYAICYLAIAIERLTRRSLPGRSMVEQHRDLVDAEIGLSESGAIPMYLVTRKPRRWMRHVIFGWKPKKRSERNRGLKRSYLRVLARVFLHFWRPPRLVRR